MTMPYIALAEGPSMEWNLWSQSLDGLMAVSLLVIPGLVMQAICSLQFPINKNYNVYTLVAFGFFNFSMFFWIIPVSQPISSSGLTIILVINYLLFIFACPAALGLAIGSVLKLFSNNLKMKRTGFPLISIIPTAWDYKFYGIKGKIIVVTLKNSSIIRGYIGQNSYISSSENHNDIYIEKLYKEDVADGEKKWLPVEGDGILICGNEISTIEFFDPT